MVPSNPDLRSKVLREFHSTPKAGHPGLLQMYKSLNRKFYWQGMQADIKKYVSKCTTCQCYEYETTKPGGMLQTLPILDQIWEDISMAFIEGLLLSFGKNSILVAVDRLSKYGHFCALGHPYSAKTIADVFICKVAKLHGMPRSIVSNRDQMFISNFWKEFFSQQGTYLKMSTAYHPQMDGQTDVWRLVCGASPLIGQNSGQNGYHGLNGAIIHHIILP